MIAGQFRKRRLLLLAAAALLCAGAREGQAAPTVYGVLNGTPGAVLGQSDYVSGGTGRANGSGLNYAWSVAADTTTGRLYVCDKLNNRVLFWDNAASRAAGAPADGVLGQPDFISREGQCAADRLSDPEQICVDGQGNLWVAERQNYRVVKFAAPIVSGQAASLVIGQDNLSAMESGNSLTRMGAPTGVAVDSRGNVWVADMTTCRVLRFPAPAGNSPAADIVLGTPGLIESRQDALNFPQGVALESDTRIWITEVGNARAVLYDLDVSAAEAQVVVGQPDFVTENSDPATTMGDPRNPCVDRDGNLWVPDIQFNRVLKYSAPVSSGALPSAVLGQPDYSVTSSSCNPTSLREPSGICQDAGGNFWVADSRNNRALRFGGSPAPAGQAAVGVLGQTSLAGNTATAYSPDQLNFPYDVAVNTSTGRVYVCDRNNSRVLWWNGIASLTSGKPADGVVGQPDYSTSGGRGNCTQSTLSRPRGICVDGQGNLWVADTDNMRVLKFGNPTYNGAPALLVLGPSDFVSGGDDRKSPPARRSPVYRSGGGGDVFSRPGGVRVDGNGDVWVADDDRCRVLKFTRPSVNGQAPDLVLGQQDLDSSGWGCSSTAIGSAAGLSFDPDGNLWVSDPANNRVLRFSPPFTNGKAANLVLGQSGFNTSDSACARNGMCIPIGVSVDDSGRVWVADNGNNRVLVFDAPSASGQEAALCLGQASYTDNAEATARNGFRAPYGAFADSLGNVWVSDSGNNRVLRLNNFAITSVTPASADPGGVAHITGLVFAGRIPSVEVRLEKSGQHPIYAANTVMETGSLLTCDFDLTDAEPGCWDIVAVSTDSCGSLAWRMKGGFRITGAGAVTQTVNPGGETTVTFAVLTGQGTVVIPPNTFPGSVTVTVSTLTVPSADRDTVRTSGIGVEITNDQRLQPLQPITIRLYYQPADVVGIDERTLVIARYDEAARRWILLPSRVDTAARYVEATIEHLSQFAIVFPVPAANLATVKAYPMPFRPSRGPLTIDNLTEEATVRIYTIAGELVRTVPYASADGRAFWDGRNDNGRSAASGIYIMSIDSSKGNKKLKIAVER